MRDKIVEYLGKITEEEQAVLDGNPEVRQDIYTSEHEFIVDSQKLLANGKLIGIRPHTRFVHFPRHSHNYIEMLYVVQGQLVTIINDTERISMSAGDILFLGQHAVHEILPAKENDITVNFIILPEFFRYPIGMMDSENILIDFIVSSLSKANSVTDYIYIQTKDILPVENLIENMIWTLVDKTSASHTILQVSMGLIFLNLSRYAELINRNAPDVSPDRNLLFSILNYIENHYRDGSLQSIVSSSGYPDYYISRLLKKHTGMNFKELLQKRKLQQAIYLLEHTTLPVDLIIERIGYENSSYFYRKFRAQYGCSPKEYRGAHSLIN
ncbi:MAG: AraC family transcriptional regulator [Blautia sp.]|nr:AraC family transcriptional regulator [Lachnoclostridium sp.]MCM1212288.1 AraC family transcriptional regulator [Blautia sp.]